MKTKQPAIRSNGRKTAAEKVHADTWVLRLYVAGEIPKSISAVKNLKLICEDRLKGNYHLDVIDLVKNPRLAHDDQILAVPTLVRKLPLPVRNIIGDLSNTQCVLAGLEIIDSGSVKRM